MAHCAYGGPGIFSPWCGVPWSTYGAEAPFGRAGGSDASCSARPGRKYHHLMVPQPFLSLRGGLPDSRGTAPRWHTVLTRSILRDEAEDPTVSEHSPFMTKNTTKLKTKQNNVNLSPREPPKEYTGTGDSTRGPPGQPPPTPCTASTATTHGQPPRVSMAN